MDEAAQAVQSGIFGIGEAASRIGVSPSTLRAWEAVGLNVPGRDPGGRRQYSAVDVENLAALKRQLDDWKGSLRALRQAREAGGAADPAAGEAEACERQIAQRLRTLRNRHGLSVREAARRAGLSPSYLSAMENGSARPSMAAVQKLASAYGVNTHYFYEPGSDSRRKLVRANGRERLRMGEPGIAVSLLTAHGSGLQLHHFELAPGASSGGAYSHEGDEVWYVLQGVLGVWINDEFFRLERGDSLSFASEDEHRFANLADGVTIWLGANTPSTF